VSIYCKSQGIQFEENRTLKQIFTKAKVENKNVFIDAFATWCGPCKQMDSSVYTSEEVGSFFNSNFINVKIQMDKTGGDNEYIRSLYSQASGIRSKYNISVYPSYLFFNADGKITHREVGFKTAKELIELGRVALDSGRQYYSKIDKFSELPPVEMLELAREIEKVEGKNYAISLTQKYIQATEESLFNPANIRLIYDYTEGTRNKGFTFIKNNLEKIAASDPFLTRDSTYTATVLRWFLYRKISHEEIIPYQSAKNEKTDWEKIKKNVKKFGRLGFEAIQLNHK
jgi:thiol-disulfide isomerase/thioredoxin